QNGHNGGETPQRRLTLETPRHPDGIQYKWSVFAAAFLTLPFFPLVAVLVAIYGYDACQHQSSPACNTSESLLQHVFIPIVISLGIWCIISTIACLWSRKTTSQVGNRAAFGKISDELNAIFIKLRDFRELQQIMLLDLGIKPEEPIT